MKRIAVIGNGNVASHLVRALRVDNSNYIFVGGYARHPKDYEYYNDLALLPIADIYIVSVSDDAIREVTEKLSNYVTNNSIVVHTSAAKTIDDIAEGINHRGVLYPLQTFSSSVSIDLKEVPFFIESEKKDDLSEISSLALHLGASATPSNSEERKTIHLAATFACNFTNHLLYISQEILKSINLSTEVITPLVKETIKKALESPDISLAQTGAAARKDSGTIKKHETMLLDRESWLQIYKDITNSIIDKN